jgi:hypothetical protein
MTLALAGGLAFIPTRASAQTTTVKGSFDMPVAARWSQLTLVPGHYTLAIERSYAGNQFLRLRGQNGTQIKALTAFSQIEDTGSSYLRLEKIAGTYAVREFHCAAAGQAFSFTAPKDLQMEARNKGEAPKPTLVAVTSKR